MIIFATKYKKNKFSLNYRIYNKPKRFILLTFSSIFNNFFWILLADKIKLSNSVNFYINNLIFHNKIYFNSIF